MDDHSFLVVTILTGIGLLLALAWVVGRAESAARDGAWRRIAEQRRQLQRWEQTGGPRRAAPLCADCPLRGCPGDRR